MKKDAYYFPHFSNARNDAKLVKLRRVMGIEGYGMYFLILEVLREQTDFKLPISNLEDLAYEWHTSKEKLIAVVTNFDLFTIIEDKFVSIKLINYLQPYIEKSARARDAANKRWGDAKAYANALPEHSKCNASKVKETKLKQTKPKKTKSYSDEIKNFTHSLFQYFDEILIPEKKEPWYDIVEKCIKLDKLSFNQIEASVKKGREDGFWSDNFKSLTKLRTKTKDGVLFSKHFLTISKIAPQKRQSASERNMNGYKELSKLTFPDDDK